MQRTAFLPLVLLASGLAATTLSGCGGHGSDPSSETASTPAGLVADFTVRGRVMQLPDPARPASAFKVHHEPIPEWQRNYHGLPVGMNAMVMEFPPASPEVIEGVSVGDVVSMTFRVEYDEEGALKGWKATRVEKLPGDTSLAFDE